MYDEEPDSMLFPHLATFTVTKFPAYMYVSGSRGYAFTASRHAWTCMYICTQSPVGLFWLYSRAQDFIYPPVLSLILEECWQQDHFMRPSARTIFDITSFVLSSSSPHSSQSSATPSSGEAVSILLDSFILHPVNRVTGCHAFNFEGAGFETCMGLSSQDVGGGALGSTIVMGVAYNKDTVKSELEIDVSYRFPNRSGLEKYHLEDHF